MLINYTEQDVGYDQRHGGPYDRGSADAYYWRAWEPHYYLGATYQSGRVELKDMTAEEIAAYTAGYRNTHERKDWF
jgi:hypothetical protein